MGLAGLTAVTFALLDNVNMKSSRNQLVLGLSLIVGLSVPYYISINEGKDWTGNILGYFLILCFQWRYMFIQLQ